jgi:hypothetical protein
MGWFWDSNPSNSTSQDAYKNLDPSLRDFLDQESASQAQSQTPLPKSKDSPSSSPDGAPSTYRSQVGLNNPGLSLQEQNAPPQDRPAVPQESLFPDGRYAHLWKDYRPYDEISSVSKTDQDKLADVVSQYKDRKAAIGRAALENCVAEQLEEQLCWRHGGFTKTMTMCRTENRAFNRCYTMQSRFLKALGYLSNQYATPEEEEKIQMHADKLYHEMLEREKTMNEAKGKGQETAALPPLISPEEATKALGEQSAFARARQQALEEGFSAQLSSYTPEKQKEIKERLKGMNEQERQMELQLVAAETRAQLEMASKIRDVMEEERQHRADRRERGKETLGDTLKKWGGWKQ